MKDNTTINKTNQMTSLCANMTIKAPTVDNRTSKEENNRPARLPSRKGLIKIIITKDSRNAELLRNSGWIRFNLILFIEKMYGKTCTSYKNSHKLQRKKSNKLRMTSYE
jgi:hypothetical protein